MPNYYNNPYYPQGYYQPQQQMAPAPQVQTPVQATPQIQNGGFVSVRNETEARNYPVAPGNSLTFKDETAPYIYTKTMGFSQLDRPIFDKYKLVKEIPAETSETREDEVSGTDTINTTIDALKAEIEAIWSEIETIKKKPSVKPATTSKKKEVEEDEL